MRIEGVRTLKAYFQHVRGIVIRAGLYQGAYAIQLNAETNFRGIIYVDSGVVVPNGGVLRFIERVEIADGDIQRLEYSYAYTHPNGFYFRYDKDPDRARLPAHPLTHLHARAEQPRFPTHETRLDELIPFIQAAL